jgi:hypothetical protein
MQELHAAGGRMLDEANSNKLKSALFQDGKLNRHMIARDIDQVISVAGIDVKDRASARFLAIPASGIGPDHPESGEKLSLVVAVYRARTLPMQRPSLPAYWHTRVPDIPSASTPQTTPAPWSLAATCPPAV